MNAGKNETGRPAPTRRHVLALGTALAFPRIALAQTQLSLIDSHVHLVSDDAERYPPHPLRGSLRPGVLDNPVTPTRVLAWMDENGVSRAVVVQRTQVYGYDNSYVLDAGERYSGRLTAIACVNAQDKKAPRQVEQWVKERGAAGIRLTASDTDVTDIAWLASPAARETWAALDQAGGTMCLLIRDTQRQAALGAVAELATSFPKLPIVIDHLADADVASPDSGIDAAMRTLIPRTNIRFKFSTITFRRLADAKVAPGPFLARWCAVFEANRLLWGSDIGNSDAAYADMTKMAREAFAGNEKDGASALAGTAAETYGRYYKKS